MKSAFISGVKFQAQNGFKNDLFDIHLVSVLSIDKEIFNMHVVLSRGKQGKSFVKIYMCFITHKDSFTARISFALCS